MGTSRVCFVDSGARGTHRAAVTGRARGLLPEYRPHYAAPHGTPPPSEFMPSDTSVSGQHGVGDRATGSARGAPAPVRRSPALVRVIGGRLPMVAVPLAVAPGVRLSAADTLITWSTFGILALAAVLAIAAAAFHVMGRSRRHRRDPVVEPDEIRAIGPARMPAEPVSARVDRRDDDTPSTDQHPAGVAVAHPSPYPGAAGVARSEGDYGEFAAGLGNRVLPRAVAFIEALADRGRVDSTELARLLDASPRALGGQVLSPLARRARTVGVSLPYEAVTDSDSRRCAWHDSGEARAMATALIAERDARASRGDLEGEQVTRFHRATTKAPDGAADLR